MNSQRMAVVCLIINENPLVEMIIELIVSWLNDDRLQVLLSVSSVLSDVKEDNLVIL